MINEIIEAISVALYKEFGEEYEIYMEEIEQDLKEPCFFIFCLNPATKPCLGKRYFKSNPFCIQYFPKSEEKQRECNGIAERMYNCLEYIYISDSENPNMGRKMNYEVVDGVLNFFVDYDFFVIKKENNAVMEVLEIQTNAKAGG